MEIVCEACRDVGPPASVWRHGERVALECRHCGHLNRLDQPAPPPTPSPTTAVSPSTSPAKEPAPSARAPDAHAADDRHQCPKCAHRQPTGNEGCARCGFVFANYQPGKMAWETPPDGKADAWHEASTLWAAVVDDPQDEARHRAFTVHCHSHQLDDFAARQYRFFLADHPGHPIAQTHLDSMVEYGRQQLLSQLSAQRERQAVTVVRTRQVLMWVVFVVALAGAVILFVAYPNLF